MAQLDPLATILARNVFYRNGYRTLLRISLIQGFVILALAAVVVVLVFFVPPSFRYFSVTSGGSLTPMTPISQPTFNDTYVTGWAKGAINDVMTLDYRDFGKRLTDSNKFFTRGGWDSFMAAVTKSRLLDGIRERKQIVSVQWLGEAKISQQALVKDTYVWEVTAPVNIQFQSGSTQLSSPRTIILRIVRVPFLENPTGLGISQWIEAPLDKQPEASAVPAQTTPEPVAAP